MKTYTVTATNADGVSIDYEAIGKRAAARKCQQLRLANTMHEGVVISLPRPENGETWTWTNVGGSTVWKLKILETPAKRERNARPVKADMEPQQEEA